MKHLAVPSEAYNQRLKLGVYFDPELTKYQAFGISTLVADIISSTEDPWFANFRKGIDFYIPPLYLPDFGSLLSIYIGKTSGTIIYLSLAPWSESQRNEIEIRLKLRINSALELLSTKQKEDLSSLLPLSIKDSWELNKIIQSDPSDLYFRANWLSHKAAGAIHSISIIKPECHFPLADENLYFEELYQAYRNMLPISEPSNALKQEINRDV